MISRCYSDLIKLKTFEDRFNYLRLKGSVGQSIFGFDRYLNQSFYKSREWLRVRNHVILRDNGCDLGIQDRQINHGLLIHHMNPITLVDLEPINPDLLDPEFLISTTNQTHQAIHYSDETILFKLPKKRTLGDTKLW